MCCCALLGCGSDKPESTVGPDGSGGTSQNGTGGRGVNLGGGLSDPNAGTGPGMNGTGGSEGCAATNSEAKLNPVYLLFLLDESGSMGEDEARRQQRWNPVTAALNAFYADSASAGLMASLNLFPKNKNLTMGVADSNLPPDCQPADYVDPVTPPRMLPDTTTFAAAIDAVTPPNEYGTPTLPALQGTIQYAESLLAEDPARKVAVVLVTDGEPHQCDGNNVENIAAAAAAVADTIPTYVIGVGESLQSLHAIAVGGGTEQAFIVPLQNPEQTRTALLAAFDEIRGGSISCELDIPAPPVGKRLDPDKVRVQLTPGGQAPTELPYDANCAAGAGWHYDDPAAPKRILLCDATCSSAKVDTMGKLDVVFGCENREDVK
jgi:hypothetical protein